MLKFYYISRAGTVTIFQSSPITSNLQNILQSSSETCMWIWAHSEKFTYFIQKWWILKKCWNFIIFLGPALSPDSAGPRNIMKFQHFFKIHQILSNLQNILESSSETCMWNLSLFGIFLWKKNLSLFREVNFFNRKMPTVPALEISRNFNIFSKFTKFHQTCRTSLNGLKFHILESSSETCMWNLSPFREVKFFHRKMVTVSALEI